MSLTDFNRIDKKALDRHITGNYGEDRYDTEVELAYEQAYDEGFQAGEQWNEDRDFEFNWIHNPYPADTPERQGWHDGWLEAAETEGGV